MNISFIIEKKRFLLILVPLLSLFQACNNDVFVDRDFMDVSVSERMLDYKGGRSVVKFKYKDEKDLPYVTVGRESPSTGTYEIYKSTYEEDGKSLIGDGMFLITAEYDHDSGEMLIDLQYNAYTDTLYVYVSRDISSVSIYQSEVIKVKPSAVPARITDIDYIEKGKPAGSGFSEKLNIQYVNVLDEPVEYDPYSKFEINARGHFIPDYPYVMDLFGNTLPEVPLVINSGNSNSDMNIDAKVLFSNVANNIPDMRFIVNSGSKIIVPPRSLSEIKVSISYVTYSFTYIADIENSELEEFRGLSIGTFYLDMPVNYTMIVKSYDLETGEEL